MTRRRSSRPSAPQTTVNDLLRFSDGAVIDPGACPRRIHARAHWTWDPETRTATCHCPAEAVA